MNEVEDPINDLSLGGYVRRAREGLRLTLRAIEDRTSGVLQSGYVSQIETGKIASPSPSMLRELATVLDVPFEDLMTLAGHYVGTAGVDANDRSLAVLLNQARPLTPAERSEVIDYIKYMVRGRRKKAE